MSPIARWGRSTAEPFGIGCRKSLRKAIPIATIVAILLIAAAPLGTACAEDGAGGRTPGRPWVGVGGFTGSGSSQRPTPPASRPLRPNDLGIARHAEGPSVAGRPSAAASRPAAGMALRPNDLGTPGNDER